MTFLPPRPATGWRGEPAPLSKRAMLAALDFAPVKATMPARNTLDSTDAAGVRRIRLHQTDILTIRPDGGFTICTGGFNTVTTRARLNAFLPAGWQVYTEAGRIHLRTYADNRPAVPFLESVEVTAAGQVLPDLAPADLDRDRKLIDSFMTAARKRGLPTAEESRGDPWVIGAVSPETVRDWLESGYWTRTLYVLALRSAGISEQGVGLFLHMADNRGGALDSCDWGRVRRYIRRTLGYS